MLPIQTLQTLTRKHYDNKNKSILRSIFYTITLKISTLRSDRRDRNRNLILTATRLVTQNVLDSTSLVVLFVGINVTLKDRRKRFVLGAGFYKSRRDTQSALSIGDEKMVKETGTIRSRSTVLCLGFGQTLIFVSHST